MEPRKAVTALNALMGELRRLCGTLEEDEVA